VGGRVDKMSPPTDLCPQVFPVFPKGTRNEYIYTISHHLYMKKKKKKRITFVFQLLICVF
jgi:hypothetical protein